MTTRSPSVHVTVPAAPYSTSPRASSTPTLAPPTSGLTTEGAEPASCVPYGATSQPRSSKYATRCL